MKEQLFDVYIPPNVRKGNIVPDVTVRYMFNFRSLRVGNRNVTNDVVAKKISELREVDFNIVKKSLQYNVFTFEGMAMLTGLTREGVRTKLTVRKTGIDPNGSVALNRCFPFRLTKEGKPGPEFIHRDHLSEALILRKAGFMIDMAGGGRY